MLTPLAPSAWNAATATHLLNRAGFGGSSEEVEALRRKGLALAVRDLVEVPPSAAEITPPSWAHPKDLAAMRMEARQAKSDPEQGKEKMKELRMMEGEEALDLRSWWLTRMFDSPTPLLEKMTLFWHGHFATSAEKVKDLYWMWLQNDTLRRNALGPFALLVKKISRDPAMMIYLDLQQSRREHPNENWARELMELFTVGIGHYTEQDVRESARAFTGYRINFTNQQFRFAPAQQDRTPKTFMGRSGPLNGDDIIDILVSQPACAQFIGRKLWRFFVEDEPADETVDAVAKSLHSHNFELRPVLHEIFTSAAFYSDRVMRSQIKSPVQFIVQTARMLDAPLPAPLASQNAMRQMGQILFAPPNVKGWDGGKSWITTSTLLFRYNFANYLINGDAILAGAGRGNVKSGPGFQRPVQKMAGPAPRDPIDINRIVPAELRGEPEKLVDHLSARLYQASASETDRAAFLKYLEARKPDTSDATLRGLVHLMMSTPQFQLA